MVEVDIEAVIDAPIEDVFDRLIDIPRYAQWLPASGMFVSTTREPGEGIGVGTKYTDEMRLGTVRGEVSTFAPPREVVFHYTAHLFGVLAMEGWPGYVLEPLGQHATQVHHRARGVLYGSFRVLRPLVQSLAWHERRRTVRALKASFESARLPTEAPPHPSTGTA